jgi:hypothetical protein
MITKAAIDAPPDTPDSSRKLCQSQTSLAVDSRAVNGHQELCLGGRLFSGLVVISSLGGWPADLAAHD